jgi:sulfate adenylyltransferase subunit 1 (EFTu-like GTPase family)
LEEDKIIRDFNANPIAVDRRKIENHSNVKDLVDYFESNFNQIRTEFRDFIAKWM